MDAKDAVRAILSPRSVALVGASLQEDSIGWHILKNLIAGDGRSTPVKIYPVNPRYSQIAGLRCYPSVRDLPESPDLAVIAVQRDLVLEVVRDCAARGVRGLAIITAGFKETGAEGARLERELARLLKEHGMRAIGPNCMGLINTDPGVVLNASFTSFFPPRGPLALATQSGSLGEVLMEMLRDRGLGVAQFVNLGNRVDLSENELLEHWAEDPQIKLILLYLESFAAPERFLALAREISREKPLIVLQAGRGPAGRRAVASHTGSLAASAAAIDDFLAQAGALRVGSLPEMVAAAEALLKGPLPRRDGLAIITNAGGPGILAADVAEGRGLRLERLPATERHALKKELHPAASVENPFDLVATAGAKDYRKTLQRVLESERYGAAVVIFRPPAVLPAAETRAVLEAIKALARRFPGKPLLACSLGNEEVEGELRATGLPVYRLPEEAVWGAWALFAQKRRRERPRGRFRQFKVDRARAAEALGAADRLLSFAQGAELLRAYGIPVVPFGFAESLKEALEAAVGLGFPLVLKLDAPGLAHKSEHGAVITGIRTKKELREAYARLRALRERLELAGARVLLQKQLSGHELILGATRDPALGPLILFGLGGVAVEALQDVAFRGVPLTDREAAELVRQPRGAAVLQGFRGRPGVDPKRLEELVLRLAQLLIENEEIIELDINPLIVGEDGMAAVDVLVRLARREQG